MNYLISRSRNQLLLIVIGIPILAHYIFKLTGTNIIHWSSVSILIALYWEFGTILKLNKVLREEFSLTITKIAVVVWTVVITIGIFRFLLPISVDPTSDNFSFGWYLGISLTINLLYFYLIYILTRMYNIATTKQDPGGFAFFPNYLSFLVFPIAIWRFQNVLKDIEIPAHNNRHEGKAAL